MSNPIISIKQETINAISKVVDETTADFLDKLPKFLQNKLQNCVAKILGFEQDNWRNEWKVDHCNNRISHLTSLLNDRVKTAASLAINKIEFIMNDELILVLQKEFDNEVKRVLQHKVREIAQGKAIMLLAQLMDDPIDKVKVLDIDPKHVTEPNYGKLKLEEQMLHTIIEDNLKKESGNEEGD